jgi:hypothetical protein
MCVPVILNFLFSFYYNESFYRCFSVSCIKIQICYEKEILSPPILDLFSTTEIKNLSRDLDNTAKSSRLFIDLPL